MPDRSSDAETVSSPLATGGSGTFFEQHVDALFLSLLLVRAPLPVLRDCQIEEVHLQAEHLGWKTDDVLVIGVRADGAQRRLALQVKRQFTVSDRNDDCRRTFSDFWGDFRAAGRFNPELDRFGLVSLRGTNVLLNDFSSLLDCARSSPTGAEFARKLAIEGLLSKTARGYAMAIRSIVDEVEGAPVSDDELRAFLAAIHLLPFDLNTDTAQQEAWIKCLLAQATTEPGPLAAADDTWRQLLEVVGAGMPRAASFRYDGLPEQLRRRHAPVSSTASGAIQALTAHSETTLNGIRGLIAGKVAVARELLAAQVVGALGRNQVVVVSGPAGFGKSALAKRAIERPGDELHVFAFRAEEFGVSHIDQALQQAQIPVHARELLGLLAAQGKKVVLIESIERLLERPVRDAFSDLLNLAKEDRNLCLLLTCRDYSLETVAAALLREAGLGYEVVDVPPLSDEELAEVSSAIPGLLNALEHPSLRRLLRSPYLLDKAAQMDWSDRETLPNDEREFRRRCWAEVIRRDGMSAEGMPLRREKAFEELAVRRARELRPYVNREELDAGALEALRVDGLIVASSESSQLVAPAHDVLEDWAIIQWLATKWSLHEGETLPLVEAVGGYPAIRRGFRRWLAEMLRAETAGATDFVLSVYQNEVLPAYFRDDVLVCTLQSTSAREFLERHQDTLLADEGRLLVRVIHLLRVACKTSPRWIRAGAPVASYLLMPEGDAWGAVLHLAVANLDRLLPAQIGLLLGVIEDWTNAIDWKNPEPEGYVEAGKIAYALLGHLDGYRMDDMRKRVLKVIAKVPTADEGALRELIDRACEAERRDRGLRELAEVLLKDIGAPLVCRALPDEIMRLFRARYCLSEADLESGGRRAQSFDVEPHFGIKEHSNMDYVQASAIRGPFMALLQHHPRPGVEFIIELMNHGGTWYGEQKWLSQPLEPAEEIELAIPGEAPVTQWANWRLWGLFRGMSVGPYVLEAALMALESWLLGISEIPEVNLEMWLLKILRESNNVAATAVVASVCNAHPGRAGRAALAILNSRELIRLDQARMAQESSASLILGLMPSFGLGQLYENERKASNALPHRKYDLEALAVRLQLGSEREKVFEIIDRHRAALPPVEEQSNEDRLWRLALHRMDVRGYRPVEGPAEPEMREGSTEGEAEGRVLLGPGQIEADVQELIDRHALVAVQQEVDLSLLNWGRAVWEHRESPRVDAANWREVLAKARDRDRHEEPEDFTRGGPGLVAAVCVRDYWDQMDDDHRKWCVDKLLTELERNCDSDDYSIRHSRGLFEPDRPAAYLLPLMLGREASEAKRSRILEAIAKALTHASDEVMMYAAAGIGVHSGGEVRDFSHRCAAALANGARLMIELQEREREKPWGEQLRGSDLTDAIKPALRQVIRAGDVDVDRDLSSLDLSDWPGRVAARQIQQIFHHQPDVALAVEFHRRLARCLVDEWEAERADREHRRRPDHEFAHDCLIRIAAFVLKLDAGMALSVCQPLLEAVANHSRELVVFLQWLVVQEDQCAGETSFWEVWQAFADRISEAPWIAQVDSDYGRGRELVAAMFLGHNWKEGIRHWRRLEGNAHRVDQLASRLAGSARVLEAYSGFLHDVGESCLPKAFTTVANSLKAGNAADMLASENSEFYLEALLQRHVYGEPFKLKQDPVVRAAVLSILDLLVEAGSSASYRMRDDFVTPLREAT